MRHRLAANFRFTHPALYLDEFREELRPTFRPPSFFSSGLETSIQLQCSDRRMDCPSDSDIWLNVSSMGWDATLPWGTRCGTHYTSLVFCVNSRRKMQAQAQGRLSSLARAALARSGRANVSRFVSARVAANSGLNKIGSTSPKVFTQDKRLVISSKFCVRISTIRWRICLCWRKWSVHLMTANSLVEHASLCSLK